MKIFWHLYSVYENFNCVNNVQNVILSIMLLFVVEKPFRNNIIIHHLYYYTISIVLVNQCDFVLNVISICSNNLSSKCIVFNFFI